MRKRNSGRHKLLSFIDGIAEHHSLISCADILFIFSSVLKSIVYSLSYIRRLLINELYYLYSMTVKAKLRTIISDVVYCIPDRPFNIDIGRGGNLPGKHDIVVLDHCFNSHTGIFILFYICVKDRIRYHIAYLIRMSFCNRF